MRSRGPHYRDRVAQNEVPPPAPLDSSHVRLVWYVAYGSNMVPHRLACYLGGGRPEGSDRTYLGTRDPRPPRESRAVSVPHRLFFAGVSRVWGGGGVAFIEQEAGIERPGGRQVATPAVAHLISVEQLSDLVAQENGGEAPGDLISDLPECGRSVVVADGRYDVLVGLEPIDGRPAVALTAGSPPSPNPPSPAYGAMVRRGRRTWWGGHHEGPDE